MSECRLFLCGCGAAVCGAGRARCAAGGAVCFGDAACRGVVYKSGVHVYALQLTNRAYIELLCTSASVVYAFQPHVALCRCCPSLLPLRHCVRIHATSVSSVLGPDSLRSRQFVTGSYNGNFHVYNMSDGSINSSLKVRLAQPATAMLQEVFAVGGAVLTEHECRRRVSSSVLLARTLCLNHASLSHARERCRARANGWLVLTLPASALLVRRLLVRRLLLLLPPPPPLLLLLLLLLLLR